MNLGRLLVLGILFVVTAVACQSQRTVVSAVALKRAYWGQPAARAGADVTSQVVCPNGYPCDVFANPANYGDSRFDLNNKLTVIWTCQPQNLVLSEIVAPGLKARVDCVGGPPLVPRRIDIIDASWGAPNGRTVNVTDQVREICGNAPARCQVPAMAYIFGTPDRVAASKTLRIRFTCNGQTTPGQQATENSIADLRCERASDLN